MARTRITVRLALLGSVLWSTAAFSCVPVQPDAKREVVVTPAPRGKGPPPHAPAHGYRRRFQQDGVTLELDTGRGVYVVVELEDVFFFEKRYYRCGTEGWFASVRPDAGWIAVAIGDVPVGLRDYTPRRGKPVKDKKQKH